MGECRILPGLPFGYPQPFTVREHHAKAIRPGETAPLRPRGGCLRADSLRPEDHFLFSLAVRTREALSLIPTRFPLHAEPARTCLTAVPLRCTGRCGRIALVVWRVTDRLSPGPPRPKGRSSIHRTWPRDDHSSLVRLGQLNTDKPSTPVASTDPWYKSQHDSRRCRRIKLMQILI